MATDLVYQGPEGQTAVVSVPMQSGSANAFITRIWTHMPLDVQDSVRLPQPVLSVDELLPQDRRYYQYAGSITQPPCTEGVLRIVGAIGRNLTAEENAFFVKRYGDGVPEDQVAALIAQYQAPAMADQPMRAAGGLRAV